MPELVTDPQQNVRSFYEFLRARDAARLAGLMDAVFDDGMSLRVPASLPYGGVVSSARRLKKLFLGLVAAPEPMIELEGLRVERTMVSDDAVAAELAFDWRPPTGGPTMPMRAVECWSFRDGRAIDLQVYYWDTVPLVERLCADG